MLRVPRRLTVAMSLLAWVSADRVTRAGSAAADSPPNLVLILCDNLGYGDIEPFGSQIHRTPALTRMAAEGTRLTHFYATAGVCTASRSSFMTGCYAQRVGMHINPRDGLVLRPISPYGLHPNEITVAEVLKTRGYATALIGKWHLGDQPEFLPTRQGFDRFFGIPYSDDMTQDVGRKLGQRYDGDRWPPLPLMSGDQVIDAPVDRRELTRRYTEVALQFIRDHRQQPFFLFLSHATPGSTRTPFVGSAFRGRSRNGPWGDSVEEIDWSTGAVCNELRKLGLAERTFVLWTSDNGAPLARNPRQPDRGVNRPLAGRGYTTAEGGFRVPTIAWWPSHIPAGRTCAEMITAMDWLPTCAGLAGAAGPRQTIDGFDVSNLLLARPGAHTPYQAFYYYYCNQLQAVRCGPWKLFLPLGQFTRHPYYVNNGKRQGPLLFNVVDDTGCTKNVAADHPEIVARLTRSAEQARKELGDVGRAGDGQRPAGHVSNPTARRLR